MNRHSQLNEVSNERYREIAHEMGLNEQAMELVEIYLALTPDSRIRARQLLEENFGRPDEAQAA